MRTETLPAIDPVKYGRYISCVGVYQHWLRWDIAGLANIPAQGAALIVGNHAGLRLHEGWALAHAMWRREHSPRPLRGLMHRDIPKGSWVYTLQSDHMGAVPGTRENCLALLRDQELVVTYPEGAKSTAKPFSQRDQLLPPEKWGHGWAELAVRSDTPVIPVGAAGVETAIPTLFRSTILGRRFGMQDDLYPVSPQSVLTLGQPFLNPLFPLPVRCALTVGAPIVPSEISITDNGQTIESTLFDTVYTAIDDAVSSSRRRIKRNR